jgi:RNA polymerase sigma factor (sigma-70 family)
MRMTTSLSDRDLLRKVRTGNRAAYGQLWERHAEAIRTAASFFTSFDADDITAETFTRILRSLERGHGPVDTFRTYALVTARNIAAEWGRGGRDVPLEVIADVEDPTLSDFQAAVADDRSLAIRAFHSLPDRWQEVLWYSEVERMKPAEIAPLLGLAPNAVAALAVRAREGLKQGWIAAHLRSDNVPDEHKWVIERAAKYARNKLPAAVRRSVDEHLEDCPNCRLAYDEVEQASARIALLLLPVVLGAAAPGYAAWIEDRSAAAAATTYAAAPRAGMSRVARIGGAVGVAAVLVGAGAAIAQLGFGYHREHGSAATAAHAPAAPTETPAHDLPHGATAPAPIPSPSPMPSPSARRNTHPVPQTYALPAPTEPRASYSPAAPRQSTPSLPVSGATTPTPTSPPGPRPTAPANPTTPVPEPTAPTTPNSPTAPTLTLQQAAAYLVPAVTGNAEPGATVTVTWSAGGTSTAYTLSAAPDGTWRLNPPDIASAGTYRIEATQTVRRAGTTATSPAVTTESTITDELTILYSQEEDTWVFDVTGHPNTSIETVATDGATRTLSLGEAGRIRLTSPTNPSQAEPAIIRIRYTTDSSHGIDQDLKFLFPSGYQRGGPTSPAP